MSRLKPPKAALLANADDVEAQFYEALQQGDIERLMAVWADDDEIVCVHPGGARLVGTSAIRASFEAIFGHSGVPVQPVHVRRLQALGVSVHHLVEHSHAPGRPAGEDVWVVATNVYVNTPQGWRLVAHHASPGMVDEPPSAPEWPSTLH
jgi:uncharacterized protein (TIGR02246 family)